MHLATSCQAHWQHVSVLAPQEVCTPVLWTVSSLQATPQIACTGSKICMSQHLQVLQEEFQVMPNGTKRARDVPVAEKMKGGEAWKDAAIRAVKEELGSVLPVAPQVTSF